jgi:hypothetical protein
MTPDTEELLVRVLTKLETELDIRAKRRAATQAERDYYDDFARRILSHVPFEGGDYPTGKPPRPQPENDTGVWEKER